MAILLSLRRDLEAILQRVDAALYGVDQNVPRPVRRHQIPVPQTYPKEYDFRSDPKGLRLALVALVARVALIEANQSKFLAGNDLYNELCLRAAEARIYQLQSLDDTSEWETAIGVIRSLTRIVSEQLPGFVYGLASTHNTDWGQKILDILAVYVPIDLNQSAGGA